MLFKMLLLLCQQKTDCMGLSKETSLLRCSILSRVNPVEHYKISSGEKDLQKDEVIFPPPKNTLEGKPKHVITVILIMY